MSGTKSSLATGKLDVSLKDVVVNVNGVLATI